MYMESVRCQWQTGICKDIMFIRNEAPEDYEAVYFVVKNAFDSGEHADGNEQDLVNALRKG